MRLPDPHALRAEFRRRGFVIAPGALEARERSVLCDVASALVQQHSATVDRIDNGKRLSYTVVSGDRIKTEGTPLFEFYTDPKMLTWVRELTGTALLGPSPHLRSAINVNCLRTAGQQYPWHRDAVPYTSLLFLSTVPPSAGGAFLIQEADGEVVNVQPASGTLVFMDGTRCPHAVSPLTDNTLRLTVPMVYPERVVDRPEGLDEYLYGE